MKNPFKKKKEETPTLAKEEVKKAPKAKGEIKSEAKGRQPGESARDYVRRVIGSNKK